MNINWTKLRDAGLPWILKAIWNPVQHIDLRDAKGDPDHSKIVPWLFLITACVFHVIGKPFTWYELVALGSLCYGWAGWRAFLKSRTLTGTATANFTRSEQEHVSRTEVVVREERDFAAGIDPTED